MMCQADDSAKCEDGVAAEAALHQGLGAEKGGEDWMSYPRTPRVIIRQDERGDISVFSDEGVIVLWIDERARDECIYQMNRYSIPVDMVLGAIGGTQQDVED
jgi:hypothetical protein